MAPIRSFPGYCERWLYFFDWSAFHFFDKPQLRRPTPTSCEKLPSREKYPTSRLASCLLFISLARSEPRI